MTAPSAEFAAQVADAVQAERAARIESLGRDATLWLAAAPLWTRSAAKAAGFPVRDILDFVKRARDMGWCETRGSLRDGAAGELRFWMPDEHRRPVLDLLQDEEFLDRTALSMAQRVVMLSREPGTGDTAVPGALQSWFRLVQSKKRDQELVDQTRRAVEDGDLSGAQDLVSAGAALAALLGGTMELAVDRARRLFTLGTRRRQDSRALTRYLDRQELSDAVDRLLRPGTEQWALHLRGVGGVGKTMLIRYLASGRYAAAKDRPPIPIARVDFDHMNPDYPVRRPVQLLLELADELALHTAPIAPADRALSRFRATAASVHESLSSARDEHPEPMRNPRVLAAIDEFAAVLGRLPEVLLILDTCEELAKADAGNPAGSPAVENTLAILERISSRAASVRVLFAGRRPLPPRDYLAVQEVTGFTMEDARQYLATFSAAPLAPALADAMIRQSPAIDSPDTRVSPFDLALYLAWADEDPGLDPRRVEQGSDAYIEGRIIERLRDREVLAALPLLASAGRCRVTTIAKLIGGTAETLGPRLAEQEWIDHDGDPPLYVTARPALASRLRRYYAAPDRAAGFADATARLARELQEAAAAPLDEIDVDELLAALRLSEPGVAAMLWDDLAKKAALAGRWTWMLNVTSRILGESTEDQWPTERALRATVLASYIAASRRASAAFNARAFWEEVRVSAGDHPDPDAGRFLLVRAALGVLPDAPDDPAAWDVIRPGFTADSPQQRLELATAAADTVYRLVEAGASAQARLVVGDRLLDMLDGPPGMAISRVRAWAYTADGRLLAASGDRAGALDRLAMAEFHAKTAVDPASDEVTGPEIEAGLADWIPPSDLLARVLLERGLIDPPEIMGVIRAWESDALRNPGSIDAERLASFCLRTRLGHQIIPPSDVERWEEIDRYEQGRVATCSAHDLVPPLFVTLADAWLAAGDPQRALDLIERRRSAALETRGDEVTLRHADEATVRIARRLRLDDQRALLTRLSRGNDPSRLDLRVSARRTVVVAYGQRPDWIVAVSEPADWHAWWQCQTTANQPALLANWPADSTDTDLAADIELDLEEMRLLEHHHYEAAREAVEGWLSRPRPSLMRSADPYRDVRAALRRAALAGDDIHECPPEVPSRLFAEIAFEEAELLALRLPDAAARMFGYAYVAYRTSQDLIGRLLSAASRFAISKKPQDLMATREAVEDLTVGQPEVGTALDSGATAAGPWRYWTEFLGRLTTAEEVRLPFAPQITATGRVVDRLWGALVICAEIAGLVLAGWAVPAIFTIGVPSLIGLLVVAIAVTGNWRLRSVLLVADGRGVGVFRSAVVGFTALARPTRAGSQKVQLWAYVRPLELAPWYLWPRLVLMTLVAALASPFRRHTPNAYSAKYDKSLSWLGDPPAADSAWWSTASVPGFICAIPPEAAQPWERIITASLGTEAAGRVAWCRRGTASVAPGSWWVGWIPAAWRSAPGEGKVELTAPSEWGRPLAGHYVGSEPDSAQYLDVLRIRHAIGRAVNTSAGPRLDISGEQDTSGSARELLSAGDLISKAPALLVLQAEPVSGEVTGEIDDLVEKLALAVDVSEVCRTCDVLIVPAIPARFAPSVAQAIARHADTRQRRDPRLLQADLRRILGAGVPPAALDDLVLFRNVSSY